MGRTVELRRKLNDSKKASINNGLNENLREIYVPGNYLVYHLGSLSVQDLDSEAAWELYSQGANLSKISDDLVSALEKISQVSSDKIREFIAHGNQITKKVDITDDLDITLRTSGKKVETTSQSLRVEAIDRREVDYDMGDGDLSIKTAAQEIARVGASLGGLYAEVGASREAILTIKGKHVEWEQRFFAEVSASVRAGVFGVAAAACAEVGADAKIGANVKSFTTESGNEIKIQLYFAMRAFAKADAYAGVGIATKTGAYAFAGVGLTGKIGGDVFRTKPSEAEENAGGIYVSLTFTAGPQIGAAAGFTIQESREGDKVYVDINFTSTFGAALAGGEMVIGGRMLDDVFKDAKDAIVKKVKDSIGEEVIRKIEEEMTRVKEELEYNIKAAARKIKRGWDNTTNYGQKLLIAIEDGLGDQHIAMESEINRQIGKLEKYKRELNGVITKFETLGMDDGTIDSIIDEVTDPAFEREINKFFGGRTIDNKLLKKVLLDNLQGYDRRVIKLTEFLDQSYSNTIAGIRVNLASLNEMLISFNAKDISEKFTDSSDFQLMVTKINQIYKMIGSMKLIINQKKKLLKEVNDDVSLRGLLKSMNDQYLLIAKDFNKIHKILSDFVNELPETDY